MRILHRIWKTPCFIKKTGEIRYFKDYKISDYGDIIILKSGNYVKTSNNSRGYKSVTLSCDTHKRTRYMLHRLVASTFIDCPNIEYDVNHKDGNKDNNHVDNLEWISHKDNVQHSYDFNLHIVPVGEDNYTSKFSNDEVIFICKQLEKNKKVKEVSELVIKKFPDKSYKLKNLIEQVRSIYKRKCWTHISNKYKFNNDKSSTTIN